MRRTLAGVAAISMALIGANADAGVVAAGARGYARTEVRNRFAVGDSSGSIDVVVMTSMYHLGWANPSGAQLDDGAVGPSGVQAPTRPASTSATRLVLDLTTPSGRCSISKDLSASELLTDGTTFAALRTSIAYPDAWCRGEIDLRWTAVGAPTVGGDRRAALVPGDPNRDATWATANVWHWTYSGAVQTTGTILGRALDQACIWAPCLSNADYVAASPAAAAS